MPIHIINGDALKVLSRLPSSLVNCVITSPPYWGLRDYGTAVWEGGSANCAHRAPDEAGQTTKPSKGQREHAGRFAGETCWSCGARRKDEQLGLEPTYSLYVEHMVDVFREVWRVLRADGVCWLNLGDSYAAGHGGSTTEGNYVPKVDRHREARPRARPELVNSPAGWAERDVTPKRIIAGMKPKDLVGIPWRVAFALQSDGWYLRQDIIWHKPNPMPESVRDRCTKSHEYLFLLSKSARYYFDADAIAESSVRAGSLPGGGKRYVPDAVNDVHNRAGLEAIGEKSVAETRNKRSVWTIATSPFPEAHFATFPPALVEPCILAGCPPNGTVLDPFAGAGTVGLVASRLNRNAILVELSKPYCEMAARRIGAVEHYSA